MRTIPKRSLMVCWLFVIAVASFNTAIQARAETFHNPVMVLMRNYAHTPDDIVADAKLEAARILLQAHVSIAWRDIPAGRVPLDQDQSAQSIPPEPVLLIQLLSASMAAKLYRPADELGFATESTIYIFVDRLERMRRNGLVFSRSKLLGSILAHEIGHVLLGPGAHTPNGMMRAHWLPEDLIRVEQGTLVFIPQQMPRLRKGRPVSSSEIATLTPR